MSSARSPRAQRLLVAAAVGGAIGVLGAIIALTRPDVAERAEWWTYDQRVRNAADPDDASSDILVVAIDEQSIRDVEATMYLSWPWPRELHGAIADYASRGGAKAVVYDFLFLDRSDYSLPDAESFAEYLAESGRGVLGISLQRQAFAKPVAEGRWVADLALVPDRAKARAIAVRLLSWDARVFAVPTDGGIRLAIGGKPAADGVIELWSRLAEQEELAELFAAPAAPNEDGTDTGDGEPEPREPEPRELSDADLAHEITDEGLLVELHSLPAVAGTNVPVAGAVTTMLPVLIPSVAAVGNVTQVNDSDGAFRRHAPLSMYKDRWYPSLAMAAFLVGNPDIKVETDGQTLILGDRRIPLDDSGRLTVNFHGAGVYPQIKAHDVLRSASLVAEGKPPALDPEQFRGKYVVVSPTALAFRDVRTTPVAQAQAGSEVQATVLDNLLAGQVNRRTSAPLDALITFLMCLLIATVVVVMWNIIPRAAIALVITASAAAATVLAYWLLSRVLLSASHVWIAVAVPGSFAALSAFAALLVNSAMERRSRRFVQEALGRYTSPALVRELTEHPEHLSLEWGEERDMSVYFSDIAGFTTISESLEPKRLVGLLNDYLTNMTDIVLAYDGVVDKYIGDAIMAFWGAPLFDEEHARKSVLAALDMRKRCIELRPKWQKDFGNTIVARAGINSGTAVVGNMGSKHKYNYTLMGDMVNLAARLEGANKPYGTELMISEYTYAEVKDAVEVRELDLLVVKGKEQPVRVFQVLDRKGQVDAAAAELAEIYEAGFSLYKQSDFAAALAKFQAGLAVKADDGPCKTFVSRCQHFIEEPPESDWDGVWRLKEK